MVSVRSVRNPNRSLPNAPSGSGVGEPLHAAPPDPGPRSPTQPPLEPTPRPWEALVSAVPEEMEAPLVCRTSPRPRGRPGLQPTPGGRSPPKPRLREGVPAPGGMCQSPETPGSQSGAQAAPPSLRDAREKRVSKPTQTPAHTPSRPSS